MGFNSFDELLEAITVNDTVNDADFAKTGITPQAAGRWYTFWRTGTVPAAGGDGGAGSGTPGAGGTALDLADGSLAKWADVSALTRHLTTMELIGSADATYMLYDRLVSVSAVAVNSTGNKNVGSAALPRYTNGIGVECWLEVTTVVSTTAPIVSMNSYTDTDDNTGQAGATITFPATNTAVNTMVGPMPLATGDVGVKAIATINVATASAGSAAVNVVLLKPLLYFGSTTGLAAAIDLVSMYPSLPRIYDGASLGLAMFSTGTGAHTVFGKIRSAYN
jgi:hypothetical protein